MSLFRSPAARTHARSHSPCARRWCQLECLPNSAQRAQQAGDCVWHKQLCFVSASMPCTYCHGINPRHGLVLLVPLEGIRRVHRGMVPSHRWEVRSDHSGVRRYLCRVLEYLLFKGGGCPAKIFGPNTEEGIAACGSHALAPGSCITGALSLLSIFSVQYGCGQCASWSSSTRTHTTTHSPMHPYMQTRT